MVSTCRVFNGHLIFNRIYVFGKRSDALVFDQRLILDPCFQLVISRALCWKYKLEEMFSSYGFHKGFLFEIWQSPSLVEIIFHSVYRLESELYIGFSICCIQYFRLPFESVNLYSKAMRFFFFSSGPCIEQADFWEILLDR